MTAVFKFLPVFVLLGLVAGTRSSRVILRRLLSNYDRLDRPNYGGAAVNVSIGLFIDNMVFDKEKSTLMTDLYFHNTWTDPRLAFNASGYAQDVSLGPDVFYKVWRPDVYFPRALAVTSVDLPSPERSLRLNPSGQLRSSQRLQVVVPCFRFAECGSFTQHCFHCNITLQSYDMPVQDMMMLWDDAGFFPTSYSVIGGYTLHNSTTAAVTEQYTTGSYQKLMASLLLKSTSWFD